MKTSNDIRIVKIISDKSIILNVGSDDDVKVGDIFKIISPTTTEVIDPFTKKSLGMLEYVKATVAVTFVYEKMCVCQNSKSASIVDSLSYLTSIQRKPLNVDTTQISGGFEENSEKIQIGDVAVKVKNESE